MTFQKMEELIAQREREAMERLFYKPAFDRPYNFDNFVGQQKLAKMLSRIVGNCKKEKRVLDHILFTGREGLGKTTLAYLLSEELNTRLIVSNAGDFDIKAIERYLNVMQHNYLWFIDEIHRLKPEIEEVLYIVMEDFKYNGKDIPRFTLIGCTTLTSQLNKPLLNRFVIQLRLEFYTLEEIEQILENYACKIDITLTDEARKMIALRSRGVPRIALSFLKQGRNLTNNYTVDEDIANELFTFLGVDRLGITQLGRNILNELASRNKPIGLNAMVKTIGENVSLIEDEEGYLLKLKLIEIVPNGRVITEEGMKYMTCPDTGQQPKSLSGLDADVLALMVKKGNITSEDVKRIADNKLAELQKDKSLSVVLDVEEEIKSNLKLSILIANGYELQVSQNKFYLAKKREKAPPPKARLISVETGEGILAESITGKGGTKDNC